VAVYLCGLSGWIMRRAHEQLTRYVAGAVILLVFLQCALGVINVVYLLPISAAVLHNGVAALLLCTVVSLRYFTRGDRRHVGEYA
jgi:cytochrome c oxidase assembly protein subunit 15